MTANNSHSYSDWRVSLCNMGYVIVIKIILYFIYYSTQGFSTDSFVYGIKNDISYSE